MFAVLEIMDFFWILIIVCVGASSLSVYLKPKESAKISRMEAKLDLLLKQANITYEPKVPPGVMEALKTGNKIEAIRLFREATGAGLAEAKDAVEELKAKP